MKYKDGDGNISFLFKKICVIITQLVLMLLFKDMNMMFICILFKISMISSLIFLIN